MRKSYYTPKWKSYQQPISKEVIENNDTLKKFIRIRKAIFAFNFIASISLLAIIFTEVL